MGTYMKIYIRRCFTLRLYFVKTTYCLKVPFREHTKSTLNSIGDNSTLW